MIEINIQQEQTSEKNVISFLKVDNLMQNNAVFQHGVSNVIRGYASVNAFVEVHFNNLLFSAVSSDNGRFSVRIPPMEPAENLTLEIISNGEKLIFNDIAIGNVYLVAGQSNIVFPLKWCKPGQEEFEKSDFTGIRYFKVPVRTFYGRQNTLGGHWVAADKDNIGNFSGLAAFFARKLYRNTNITVGIIDVSIGGINIEAWLSRKSLMNMPEYRSEILEYENNVSIRDFRYGEKILSLQEKLDKKLHELFPEIPEDNGEKKGFHKFEFDDSNWDSMLIPDSWTQAGHNHAGIFWFRKEIFLPENAEKFTYKLHVGAVDKEDKTYVNGKLVGSTGHMLDMSKYHELRIYDIPAGIFQSGRNVIAIRGASLFSICQDGGLIGPASEMYLVSEDGKIQINLTGEWKYNETFDAGVEGMTCMRSLGPGSTNSFHIFYDNMLLPLSGTAINGIIWYQGEANSICMAHTYRQVLRNMIGDMRDIFENPELPFYIVQLPYYGSEHFFAPYSQWAKIREAQFYAGNDTNSECIVTLEFGDVSELHPVNKKAISEIIATKEIRRMFNIPAFKAPQLESLSRENNALILKFTGDEIADGADGFAIAGKDMQVFRAEVELVDRHTLKIYAPKVAAPCSVWYAWADNPLYHSLKSLTGEHASPFRASLEEPMPVGKNMI